MLQNYERQSRTWPAKSSTENYSQILLMSLWMPLMIPEHRLNCGCWSWHRLSDRNQIQCYTTKQVSSDTCGTGCHFRLITCNLTAGSHMLKTSSKRFSDIDESYMAGSSQTLSCWAQVIKESWNLNIQTTKTSDHRRAPPAPVFCSNARNASACLNQSEWCCFLFIEILKLFSASIMAHSWEWVEREEVFVQEVVKRISLLCVWEILQNVTWIHKMNLCFSLNLRDFF